MNGTTEIPQISQKAKLSHWINSVQEKLNLVYLTEQLANLMQL